MRKKNEIVSQRFTYKKGSVGNQNKLYFMGRVLGGRVPIKKWSHLVLEKGVPVVLFTIFLFVMSSCTGIKVGVAPIETPKKSASDQQCHILPLESQTTNEEQIVVVPSGPYWGKPNLGSVMPSAIMFSHAQKWNEADLHYLQIDIEGESEVEGSVYHSKHGLKKGEPEQIASFTTGEAVPLPVPTHKNKQKYIITLDLKGKSCGANCKMTGTLIVHKNGKESLRKEIAKYKQKLTRYAKHQRKLFFGKKSRLPDPAPTTPPKTPCQDAVYNLTSKMTSSYTSLAMYGKEGQLFKMGRGFRKDADVSNISTIVGGFNKVRSIVDGNEQYKSLFEQAFSTRIHETNTDDIPYVGIDTSTILSIAKELSSNPTSNDKLTEHHLLSAKLYFANEEEREGVLEEYSAQMLDSVIDNHCTDGKLDCVIEGWNESLSSYGTEWVLPFGGPTLRRADADDSWIKKESCADMQIAIGSAPTYDDMLGLRWLEDNNLTTKITRSQDICNISEALNSCVRPFNKVSDLSRYKNIFNPNIEGCVTDKKGRNRYATFGQINSCIQEWNDIQCESGSSDDNNSFNNSENQKIIDSHLANVFKKEITSKWIDNITDHKKYDRMVCDEAGSSFAAKIPELAFEEFRYKRRPLDKNKFINMLESTSKKLGRTEVKKAPISGVAKIQERFGLGENSVINPSDSLCGTDLGKFKQGGGIQGDVCNSKTAGVINDLFDRVDGISLNPKLSASGSTQGCPNLTTMKVKKRGNSGKCYCSAGEQKELKLKVPGGFKKLMFASSCGFSVNGLSSKRVQGQHRLSVRNKGSTYYITPGCSIFNYKVKPVR